VITRARGVDLIKRGAIKKKKKFFFLLNDTGQNEFRGDFNLTFFFFFSLGF